MDYGYRECPGPARETVRRRWPLWRRCAAWTVSYALVWAISAAALQAAHPERLVLQTIPDQPAPHASRPALVHHR